jgi:hypothetical protein
MRFSHRIAAVGIAVALIVLSATGPRAAQKESPRGILRNLIHSISPGSPEDLESRARETREVPTALDLYGTLESRFGSRPEGVRASIWLGLYEYGQNDPENALVHFESARKNARDPALLARATFWCEQARLITGREPITDEIDRTDDGLWGTLRGLTRVDRSIRAERRGDAEQELLALEGDARRAGLLGPQIARWGDLLRLPGPGGRIDPQALAPLLRATAELPERLQIQLQPAAPPAPPAAAKWTIQFGAFLDPEHAAALMRSLDSRGVKTRVEEGEVEGRRWFRVLYDQSLDRAAADSLSRQVQRAGGVPCQIVPAQ